ncbi:hypothetical protein TWF730_007313 [Orbilia blumenaviensis]|uniref:Uncharacterized protein n=1 Tax=Orbilia blumenaviensis TaxID=1796055 RepID=A0AAV9V7P9_9PEZI
MIQNRKCFVTSQEVLGQAQTCLFGPRSASHMHLNLQQIAAAVGGAEYVKNLADFFPKISASFGPYLHQLSIALRDPNTAIHSIEPDRKVNIEICSPMAIAAISQDISLAVYISAPSAGTDPVTCGEEALWGLIILAFEPGQGKSLSELSILIQMLAADQNLINLTRIAAEMAPPEIFRLWMEIAWAGRLNQALSVYKDCWHTITTAFGERYSFSVLLGPYLYNTSERQEFLTVLREIGGTTWEGRRCRCQSCLHLHEFEESDVLGWSEDNAGYMEWIDDWQSRNQDDWV